MKNIYEEVTNQIIEAFEKVELGEWECPWSVVGGFPTNALTAKAYRGLNVLLLLIAAQKMKYKMQNWVTYKQANELGGTVRKGEKGTKIVFYKMVKKKEGEEDRVKKTKKKGEEGEEENNTFAMLRYYTVFNVEQCDGIEINPIRNEGETNENIEAFLGNVDFELRAVGENQAAYNFVKDFIRMPEIERFTTENDYYSTLFHELGHWTGHESRLDRELTHRFYTEAYAAEELVAEFTSAFLSAQFGIEAILKHAEYIKDWKQLLKSDPYAVATCARKATEAVEYLAEFGAISKTDLSAA